MSYCVDANVFITAWHVTYPPDVLPGLYSEMKNKLPSHVILIKPIYDEIEPIPSGTTATKDILLARHPVRMFLKEDMRIKETPIDANVNHLALELGEKYEIDEHAKGASEADIKLIAFAYLNEHTVVTLESRQEPIPLRRSNYKIPLICREEQVQCIDFVELLRRCNITV